MKNETKAILSAIFFIFWTALANAEVSEKAKNKLVRTKPNSIAVADTISNGHIMLLDNPCPQIFNIKVSFKYLILDAFNRPLVDNPFVYSGCWFPQGEQASGALPKGEIKYIIGVDMHGNLTKWQAAGFKKTNQWPQ